MKVHHTLICFFFLSLRDGNTGLINAQTIIYSETEGADLTVECSSPLSESRKVFCKEKCQQEDILIETISDKAQKGRYRIKWGRKKNVGLISVTITQLTKSDSGLYRCGWGRFLSSVSHKQIEIIVVDAFLDGDQSKEKILHATTGGNIVVECSFALTGGRKYFCKGDCKEKDILVETTSFKNEKDRYSIRYVEGFSSGAFLFVSITQLTKSDSGRYGCGLDRRLSQDPYVGFRIIVTDGFSSSVPSASTETTTQSESSSSEGSTPPHTDTTTTRDMLLYVGLTLIFMVILSLSVLIFCRKRTSKAKDPAVETEYASVSEINRVYEDIGEDTQSRSPLEISSAYTSAKYSKTNGADTSDDYSAAAHSQNTAEDDWSRITYSEVDFSKRAVGSSHSALRGDADNVVYSVTRVRKSIDASCAEDDPPVYSTVH